MFISESVATDDSNFTWAFLSLFRTASANNCHDWQENNEKENAEYNRQDDSWWIFRKVQLIKTAVFSSIFIFSKTRQTIESVLRGEQLSVVIDQLRCATVIVTSGRNRWLIIWFNDLIIQSPTDFLHGSISSDFIESLMMTYKNRTRWIHLTFKFTNVWQESSMFWFLNRD